MRYSLADYSIQYAHLDHDWGCLSSPEKPFISEQELLSSLELRQPLQLADAKLSNTQEAAAKPRPAGYLSFPAEGPDLMTK